MLPFTILNADATTPILIVGDHASNRVPSDITLGLPDEVMTEHVAVDIGVAPLAAALCARLDCAAFLATLSRLVIDLNREEDAHGLIPATSDGRAISGNVALDDSGRADRIARFWRPYHDRLAVEIAARRPAMLLSLHSFTPRLATSDEPRPWQVGVLYNTDDRAARVAIPLLEAEGIVTGDNLPYSGKVLNATMNRHGEGNGIPYLGLEVRQDLISESTGVIEWADRLGPIIAETLAALA
ncbi:N-formylglutamate amidohydrolase [Sphingomonas sp. ID0503]|uniref:N-formylglutamate amidohydrolase n=1 Tax=Sphingomonas sp. ID0503 TaxID=3399691 RepID=UPI003AFA7A62